THGCDHTIDASVFGGAVFPPYRKSAHRVSSKRLPSRAVIQLTLHPRRAKQGHSLALAFSLREKGLADLSKSFCITLAE
ncbi:MAG: hypothetical protein M3436_15410, partial [Pseudomonadota bacterium]|nr:hypothetical protein [Pseudomonadota bacterium]